MKFQLPVSVPKERGLQVPFCVVPTLVLPEHHVDTFERVHDFHLAVVDGEVKLLVAATHRSGTRELIVLDQACNIPENHEAVRKDNIGLVSVAIDDNQIVSGNLELRNRKTIMDICDMGSTGKSVVIEREFVVIVQEVQIHQAGFCPIVGTMNQAGIIITSLGLQVVEFQN